MKRTWLCMMLEDGYLRGSKLTQFLDELTVQMRDVLKEAGVKIVR